MKKPDEYLFSKAEEDRGADKEIEKSVFKEGDPSSYDKEEGEVCINWVAYGGKSPGRSSKLTADSKREGADSKSRNKDSEDNESGGGGAFDNGAIMASSLEKEPESK